MGTKEVDGVKVEALGTKSPDEAAKKGLLGVAGAVNDAVGVHSIGLEGSLVEGPWSYRILSVLLVSPIYATFLVFFGTLAGRHRFFASMAGKIFNRFLPTAVSERIARAFGVCFPLSKGV